MSSTNLTGTISIESHSKQIKLLNDYIVSLEKKVNESRQGGQTRMIRLSDEANRLNDDNIRLKNEISELKFKIFKQDEGLRRGALFENQLGKVKTQLDKEITNRTSLEAEYKALKEQLFNCEKHLEVAQNQINNRTSIFNKDSSHLTDIIETQSKKIEQRDNKYIELQNYFDSEKKRMTYQLQTMEKTKNETIEKLVIQLDNTKNRWGQEVRLRENLLAEKESLQKAINARIGQINQMARNIAELKVKLQVKEEEAQNYLSKLNLRNQQYDRTVKSNTEEKSNLIRIVRKLEDQKKMLQSVNSAAKGDISSQIQQNQQLISRNQKLSQQLQTSNNLLSAQKEKNDMLQRDKGRLQTKIESLSSHLLAVGSERDSALRTISELQSKISENDKEARATKHSLESDIAQRDSIISQLHLTIENQQTKIGTLTQDKQAANHQIAKMMQGKSSSERYFDSQIKSLETQLAITEQNLKNTRQNLQETQNNLSRTQRDLNASETELKQTNQKLKYTQETLKITQKDLRETSETLRKIKESLTQTLIQLQQTRRRLGNTTECQDETKKQLNFAQMKLQETIQELKQVKSQLKDTSKQFSKTQSQLKEMKLKFDSVNGDYNSFRKRKEEQIEQLNSKINNFISDQNLLKNQSDSATKDFYTFKKLKESQIEDLNKRLLQINKEKIVVEEALSQVKEQYSVFRKRKEAQADDLNARLSSLQKEHISLKDTYDSTTRDNYTTQKKKETDLENLSERLKEANKKIEKKDLKIQELEKEIRQIEKISQMTKSNLSNAQKEELQRIKTHYINENTALKKELSEEKASKEENMQKKSQQSQQISGLEYQLKTLKDQLKAKEKANTEKIRKMEKQRDKLLEDIKNLNFTKVIDSQHKSSKELQVEAFKKTINNLESFISDQKKNNQNLLKLITDKEKQMQALETSNAMLRKQLISSINNEEITKKEAIDLRRSGSMMMINTFQQNRQRSAVYRSKGKINTDTILKGKYSESQVESQEGSASNNGARKRGIKTFYSRSSIIDEIEKVGREPQNIPTTPEDQGETEQMCQI